MPLIVRNDEQIKVGLTPGLVAGSSSFTFDGSSGKPDYRGYEIVISEYTGRSPMIKGLDYNWNPSSGLFQLIIPGDKFNQEQWYNVHFQKVSIIQPPSPSSLIDYSFFIRNINIPNLSDSASNLANVQKVNMFISKYEPECLEKLLGYQLYKSLLTENTPRIDDIISGAEYTDENGRLEKWKGLVYEPKISLIANYVYFYIQESDIKQKTGVNTTIPKGSTLVPSSPLEQMIEAWRFFSSESKSLCSFLWNKKDNLNQRVYPDFTREQYSAVINIFRPVNEFGL